MEQHDVVIPYMLVKVLAKKANYKKISMKSWQEYSSRYCDGIDGGVNLHADLLQLGTELKMLHSNKDAVFIRYDGS